MLTLEPFQGKKVRIDGALGEWPAGFEVLGVRLEGSGADSSGLVGYDDSYLYVALKAKSASIVRRSSPGAGQDRLSLEVYFPPVPGRSAKTRRIDFYPGDPGKLKGLVALDGQVVSSAEIVEYAHDDGFDLEARLPWSALPEASRLRAGLRGRLSFYDATSPGKIGGAVSTSAKKDAAMPPLPLFAEAGLIDYLLSEGHRKITPDREAFAELTGRGTLEKVALYGNLLSIVGPDYRKGEEYYLSALDVDSAEQIKRLDLVDFNGDGKAEILIEKRLGSSKAKYRQVVQVLDLDAQGAPTSIFLAEVAIATEEGKIENKLTVSSGSKPSLSIEQGKYSGFKPDTFREPSFAEGVPSAILPWSEVRARRYVYDNHGFSLSQETKGTPLVKSDAPAKPSSSPSSSSGSSAVGRKSSATTAIAPADLTRLYDSYKKARGGKLGAIFAESWVDVAEDARPERVLVQDRDLLVLGEGFLGGKGYAYSQLPVKEPRDILSMTPMELTGDEKREIVIHVQLRAQTGEKPKGQEVVRQVVFVYGIQGGKITRLFAAEVGRSLEGQQVLGTFRVDKSSGGPRLELGSGRALGFTKKTYPFPQEEAANGIEPLLLPWGPVRQKRFSFNGGSFQELH